MYFPCRRSGKELERVYDDNWQSFSSWVHRHQGETGQVTSNGTQQYNATGKVRRMAKNIGFRMELLGNIPGAFFDIYQIY